MSKLRMVISFVKKYNRLLSVSCRVNNLSLSFSCRVGEYFFVCQFLSASRLSVSCLSVSCRTRDFHSISYKMGRVQFLGYTGLHYLVSFFHQHMFSLYIFLRVFLFLVKQSFSV